MNTAQPHPLPSLSSAQIALRILESILARQLAPGTRLGEQQLAELFGVSRTLIREALTRLVTRGVVTVSARRGWFVIEPTASEARQAFEARRVIEMGLLRQALPLTASAVTRLREHIAREQAAIASDDVGARSYLLGDFHVFLCECLGNTLLSDMLRDLTARTTLTAMLHQSSEQAEESCGEHLGIVAALENGDLEQAEALMLHHLQHVEAGLQQDSTSDTDPLNALRQALAPVSAAPPSFSIAPVRSTTSAPPIPAPAAAFPLPSRPGEST
ncbi:GntR family transcriptional regulator [Herbaspirillum sp. RTI4]|uniref:GntR family transcriptional regulator n=1 Tax=Herbaspirillum sp. RTI4 TaxID=3048640 RepID=UPI002AB4B3A0|nr:GntR family transcriptional regulator [Herbaspirillum sp. RTI4]MDY7578106.1 GntR family transcriptional regulator [Herbaspirillum sp. RTI4]MEA9980695.1 GntR family transcriptional regulator [Herbaspirillum sp. RTI4]